MIRFWIASKPMAGDTRENFDYQWGYVHVALMITTPAVMRGCLSYVQHRVPDGVAPDTTFFAPSPSGWYSCADHWVEDFETLKREMFHPVDYVRRMQPHRFGSHEFTLELTDGGKLQHEEPGALRGRGGVKLLNFYRRRPGVEQAAFERWWRGEHARAVVKQAAKGALLRRYVQSAQQPLDAALFKGTLFEKGKVHTYGGIEEMWFDDLASLARLRQDSSVYGPIAAGMQDMVDVEASFSMAVVERVVWDFTREGPRAAVLDPKSFEASILPQEADWGQWNAIRPPR